MEHNKLFESMSPNRLFARCAVPSMISMGVTSLYTIVDGIFVGNYVGADALAAINLVMPLIMVSFALADLIAAGSSVQIAIRLGEKNNRDASRIFSFCSALIIAISFVVGILAFFFAEPLVRLMGADAAVTALAVEYMQVYAVFSPAIMIFFAVDNFLRICARVHYSMMMNVVIGLLNIVLDYIFIVRFGWGVGSAALGSCISLALGTLLGFLPFLRKQLPLRFVRARIPMRLLLNIIANGSSEFFSNISGSVLMMILNTVLLRIAGSMAVAAFSIVMYIDTIIKSLLFGMADSMQPAISYNYGAGNRTRMFQLEKRVLVVGALLSFATAIWMLQGGDQITALFLKSQDVDLLEMSQHAMKLFSISYLMAWVGIILSSFLTAVNRPALSLILASCQTLVFPLMCLMILPHFFALDGVWLTSTFASILTAALAVFFLLRVLRYERVREQHQLRVAQTDTE